MNVAKTTVIWYYKCILCNKAYKDESILIFISLRHQGFQSTPMITRIHILRVKIKITIDCFFWKAYYIINVELIIRDIFHLLKHMWVLQDMHNILTKIRWRTCQQYFRPGEYERLLSKVGGIWTLDLRLCALKDKTVKNI